MDKCVNPDYRYQGKKFVLLFSNISVNILCVFLNDFIGIIFKESVLRNQNLQ